MRVLVVGGGGREHALVWKLAQSPRVNELFAAPGNAGIEEVATCLPVRAEDVDGLLTIVAEQAIDFTAVGPEAPLVAGLVDALTERGHAAFGPGSAGAAIEGSKIWAKDLCVRHGIPTARAEAFDDITKAVMFLDAFEPPYVVKADGLAAGKGVVVAVSREEAVQAIEASMVDGAFGAAGDRVLIEEFLEGQEVSALALTDGQTVVPLVLAQDFKRVGDGDVGPNTGGMGAYSPVPFIDEATEQSIRGEVLEPTVRALRDEGVEYRGVLYAGLMLTDEGPKVLEFNCRFGDPETQAIIPRLRSDLAGAALATAEGRLAEADLDWTPDACVTVVLASGGYPGAYATGFPIRGLERATKLDGVAVFHAGTARGDDRVVTAGGRVLTVSAVGQDLTAARERAYEACALIDFEGKHYRTDIAMEVAGA